MKNDDGDKHNLTDDERRAIAPVAIVVIVVLALLLICLGMLWGRYLSELSAVWSVMS